MAKKKAKLGALANSAVSEEENVKDGYLIDYISGKPVKDGPEERGAVQVFARVLVEGYGYPKASIRTRPQYRVKVRPSDKKKEYPVRKLPLVANASLRLH